MDYENQLRKPIILIADDHGVMRRLLRSWLTVNFPAFNIMEAKNGEEAVYLAIAWKPEVILMDIWMPEINGFEATRRIKTTAPNIKIVIITSDDNNHCRDRASSAGAGAYVLKSEVGADLVPILREMLYEKACVGAE